MPVIGNRLREPMLMTVAGPVAVAQFAFALFAFGALTIAYVVSDFSVVNVFENSHSLKPLIYKITGVWGNHEGSMLLWVLILALFSALVAIFGTNRPSRCVRWCWRWATRRIEIMPRTGMIAAHDKMGAAIILADDGV